MNEMELIAAKLFDVLQLMDEGKNRAAKMAVISLLRDDLGGHVPSDEVIDMVTSQRTVRVPGCYKDRLAVGQ